MGLIMDINHKDVAESQNVSHAEMRDDSCVVESAKEQSPIIRPAYRAMWREVSFAVIFIIALFMLIEPTLELTASVLKSLKIEIPAWISKSVWDFSMYISLFLSWIIVCRLWYFKYSCELTFTNDSIEIKKGIFATKTIQIKMAHVTAVETSQTIIDKILGVGSLEIGSSSTSEMEIVMPGILNPNDVAQKIKSLY